jgi:intracellular multiplication protein IcmO
MRMQLSHVDRDLAIRFNSFYLQEKKIIQSWFFERGLGAIFANCLGQTLSLEAVTCWLMVLVLGLWSGPWSAVGIFTRLLMILLMVLGFRAMLQKSLERQHLPNLLRSDLRLKSARTRVRSKATGEYFLGYTSDKAKEVWVAQDEMMRHFLIAGMTGVGKTVASNLLMAQQMAKGGGLLWVDGKLDPHNITFFFQLAKWLGRESDVRIINPADPELSNTYNFVLYGSADEVASRILTTFGAATSSAGADYYKQAANQGLICILAVLKWLNLSYNCMDLAILLSHPKALEDLNKRVQAQGNLGREASAFALFLESCGDTSRKAQSPQLDTKKLRDLFGGIAGRLFVFGSGTCGEITGSYTPDINLFESICANELIYCALPSMGQHVTAQNFGKMLTGDLRSAIAKVQALPLDDRPNPPFMVWLDEVASYASAQALAAPFQQARSAGLSIGVGFQEHASMQELGPSFLGTIMGNTYSKLFFKPAELETATVWSKLLGTQSAMESRQTRAVVSSSERSVVASKPFGQLLKTKTESYTETQVQWERVSVQQLTRLGQGHAVFLSGGTHLYDLKIPMIEFSHSLKALLGDVKIQRPPAASKHDHWIKTRAFSDQGAHSSQRLNGSVKGLFLQHHYRDWVSAAAFDEDSRVASSVSREKQLRQEWAKQKFQNLAALRPHPPQPNQALDLQESLDTEVKVQDA